MEFHLHLSEELKTLFDWGSVSITLGSIFALLPHIAAALAIVWWGFRINEEYHKWKERKGKLNGPK